MEEFARRIFSLLGVAHFEERESSNCFGGRYFRAVAVGIEVVIRLADSALEEFEFCMILEAEQSAGFDTNYLQDHAHTLARLLSANGWRCFLPDDPAKVGGEFDGTIYEG